MRNIHKIIHKTSAAMAEIEAIVKTIADVDGGSAPDRLLVYANVKIIMYMASINNMSASFGSRNRNRLLVLYEIESANNSQVN